MKILSSTLLLLVVLFSGQLHAFGQCPSEMTDQQQEEYLHHLKEFRALKKSHRNKSIEDLMYVPLTIHIIQKDDGSEGADIKNIFNGIEKLNNEFTKAKIQFYICGDVNYIRSSQLFDYNDTIAGSILPYSHQIDSTINVVFHNSIHIKGFGYAGGFAPYPGNNIRITMSKGSASGYTLTHEMGHFYGLPHTFNYSNSSDISRRELVTRAEGANCATAGDAICDTPADPFVHGESRGYFSGCIYTEELFDANGDQFEPMLDNTMSYYSGCTEELLTLGQIEVIKSYKTGQYRGHERWTNNACSMVNNPTNLQANLDSKYGIVLTWEDNATNELGYLIEVSKNDTLNFKTAGVVETNSTFFRYGNIGFNSTYYFRVKPINTAFGFSNMDEVTTEKEYCKPFNDDECGEHHVSSGHIFEIGIQEVRFEGEKTYKNTTQCGEVNSYDYFNSDTLFAYKGIQYKIEFDQLQLDPPSKTGISAMLWIDVNEDGLFDEDLEKYDWDQNYYDFESTIYFPESVPVGVKLLRIRVANSGDKLQACSDYNSGEVEDYNIKVMELPSSFPLQLNGHYASGIATLKWTNTTLPLNKYYDLYRSAHGQAYELVDSILLSQDSVKVLIQTNGNYSFLLRSKENNMLLSNIFSIEATDILYCLPSYTQQCETGTDKTIENVEIFGETYYSNPSECSQLSYSSTKGIATSLKINTPYVIKVWQTKNGTWANSRYASVWIDYDENIQFDESEKIVLNKESTGLYTGTVLPPTGTTTGIKNMRVRMHSSSKSDACEEIYFGESEDYQINIEEAVINPSVELTVERKNNYTNTIKWISSGVDPATLCHVYGGSNKQTLRILKTVRIDELSLDDFISHNGTYSYLIRRASDSIQISNTAVIEIDNFIPPFQLSASTTGNGVELSWNELETNLKEVYIYRTLGNFSTTFFTELDKTEIKNGVFKDIRIAASDTIYNYRLQTKEGHIISNVANIAIDENYCIPTFNNTECLSVFTTRLYYLDDNNNYESYLYKNTCSSDNRFTEQNYGVEIDTLLIGTNYTLTFSFENGCLNNIPLTNYRNVAVWVDLNHDLSFSSDEMLYTNAGLEYNCFYQTALTIPQTSLLGFTRMRIITSDKDQLTNNACGNYAYGTGFDSYFYIGKPLITDSKNNYLPESSISVYPNPSNSGSFNIQSDTEIESVKIHDLSGKLIYSGTEWQHYKLDKGMYILEIHTLPNHKPIKVKFFSN